TKCMLEQGSVRNLEQIQEQDDRPRMPRWVTGAFLVLGGACVAFAALALSGRKTGTQAPKADPLGDLLAQHSRTAAAGTRPTDRPADDVTFPSILSDQQSPTTALAAVKGQAGSAKPGSTVLLTTAPPMTVLPAVPTAPPPAADRLPVVPLPAQHVLEATPVI